MCYTFCDRGLLKGVVLFGNKHFQKNAEQADFGAPRAENTGFVPQTKSDCSGVGGVAERRGFWKNLRSAAASPGEREVYHTPVLQQHPFLLLPDIPGPKDESLLLRKFLISFKRNNTNHLPCIPVASCCIPIRKPLDLDFLILKIKSFKINRCISNSSRYLRNQRTISIRFTNRYERYLHVPIHLRTSYLRCNFLLLNGIRYVTSLLYLSSMGNSTNLNRFLSYRWGY